MFAAVFPGQGSQYVGMGQDLYENFPSVMRLFQEAEDLLSLRFTEVMFHGPEEKLRETAWSQPALFLMSMGIFLVVKEEVGIPLAFMAGHSLGEYSAYCASHVLSFQETLPLLKTRWECMATAPQGSMVAIVGLPREAVRELVGSIPREQYSVCEVVNENAPLQFVVSGTFEALRVLEDLIQGRKGVRFIPLKVGGPFHSSLMSSSRACFAHALEGVSFRTPLCPVVTNVSGKGQQDPSTLKEHLGRQMDHPVLWNDTQGFFLDQGVTTLVELGAGNVLSGLARQTIPRINRVALGDVEAIRAWNSSFP